MGKKKRKKTAASEFLAKSSEDGQEIEDVSEDEREEDSEDQAAGEPGGEKASEESEPKKDETNVQKADSKKEVKAPEQKPAVEKKNRIPGKYLKFMKGKKNAN